MATTQEAPIRITAPNFQVLPMRIIGTAPYMQARFSEKAKQAMREKMEAGSTARKGANRTARDFDADYEAATHVSTEGWIGIPAAAFRNAAIDACRMAGFQMTRARMSVFVKAQGFDRLDATPLVRIEGEPERTDMVVRNATGVPDIRIRPLWREWTATIAVSFDADQFTASDVANLFHRAGQQVGIGEGRPFSKDSNGLGFGLFAITSLEE